MKRQTRILLLVVMAVLVLGLSGCSSNGISMYNMPLGYPGGWGLVQWLVGVIAEGLYIVSEFAGGQYWVGLIVLTLVVRSVGWPIYARSNQTTLNMQLAQPELNALEEKYRNKTDEASQRKKQAEQTEIWRKYGINPFGCLLPFLQMPIFIAMYQVVRRIPLSVGGFAAVLVDGEFVQVALKDFSDLNYSFLWIEDLGAGDPYYILPILVGLIMFGYQRYSQKKPEYLQNKKYQSDNANQSQQTMKMMSYFMVIMLVFIAWTNAGIALYWIVGNAFQFFQTYINRIQNEKKFYEMKEKY